jgi:ribosomal protein S30
MEKSCIQEKDKRNEIPKRKERKEKEKRRFALPMRSLSQRSITAGTVTMICRHDKDGSERKHHVNCNLILQ